MNTNKDFVQNLAVYLLTDHIHPDGISIALKIESDVKLTTLVKGFLRNTPDNDYVASDYKVLLNNLELAMGEIQENCYQNSIRS